MILFWVWKQALQPGDAIAREQQEVLSVMHRVHKWGGDTSPWRGILAQDGSPAQRGTVSNS